MNSEGQKTILPVEDESFIALNEKMTLENYGYTVRTANTGEKAVEIVESNPDIDLGKGIDGTEAAEKILEKHDFPLSFLRRR